MAEIIYDTFRSVNTKSVVDWFPPAEPARHSSLGSDQRATAEPARDSSLRSDQRATAGGKRRASASAPEGRMVLTVVFVCLLLWFLGLMTASSLGSVLHVLLIVAIVLFLVHIIQGRPIGTA
jgi:hypothetical protein